MRVECIGCRGIGRRQQACITQPRDGALPTLLACIDQRLSQTRDVRLLAQGAEAIAACRPIEQASEMHDRALDGFARKPFLFTGFHHASGVVVTWIVFVLEESTNTVAPANIANVLLFEITGEQTERERMAAKIA